MARVAGLDLPKHKRVDVALCYIYGVGPMRSMDIPQGDGRFRVDPREGFDRGRGLQDQQRDQPQLQGGRRSSPRDQREHPPSDRDRDVPRLAPPSQLAGAGTAHAFQRAHAPRPPQNRGLGETRHDRRPGHRRQSVNFQETRRIHGRSTRSAKRSRQARPGESRPAARRAAPKLKKKMWRDIANARVYIQSTFNNTIVNITDDRGNSIVWAGGQRRGSKAPRRARPSPRRSRRTTPPKNHRLGRQDGVGVRQRSGSGRETAIRASRAQARRHRDQAT